MPEKLNLTITSNKIFDVKFNKSAAVNQLG